MPRKKQLNGSADEVESAFYDAISRADIEALMALWADDDEIVCIHPGATRLFGHDAIRASWMTVFAAGSMHLSATRIHATQNLMSAMHNVIEVVTPSPKQQPDLHVLATNVYIKTTQGWRIVCHHASIAPGKAPPEAAKAAALLH